jgi:hypothetical protein
VNNSTLKGDSKDMEEDAVYEFPNTWPGAPSMNVAGDHYYPNVPGCTVNFTGSAWVHAGDEDDDSGDDWLIADHLMVPTGQREAQISRRMKLFTTRLTKRIYARFRSSGDSPIPGQVSLVGNWNIA